MNILVRMPNWLGDMVMATAFLKELRKLEPEATIDVIVKKEIAGLADMIEGINDVFPFSKTEHPGLGGAISFGKLLKKAKKYDVFFSLPNSFSAAAMGYAAGIKNRVGYSKELRTVWLNRSYTQPKTGHRAEKYAHLLGQYYKVVPTNLQVNLNTEPLAIEGTDNNKKTIILNFNSEAKAHRMPVDKAVSIIITLMENIDANYVLIGAPKEKVFVDSIHALLPNPDKIINLAGATNLLDLAGNLKAADLVISTDSGPGHLSNALGTPTISYIGAGDENETIPYNRQNADMVKTTGLDCMPCVKNECKLYGIPKCLTQLDEMEIVTKAKNLLNF